MKVEKISLVDLEPAEYNPRKISEQELVKLENSINEFGLVDPIIINLKNNKIIGGHQRYEALYNKYTADNDFQPELNLIRLGDIGWVFEDTELKIGSEAQEKALNLALNKISGEWDTVKLQPLLEDLKLSELDIGLTGFDDYEISSLTFDFDDFDIDEDNYPEDDLPEDYVEVEGEPINQSYVVYISFLTEENADNFLESLGLEKRMGGNVTVSIPENLLVEKNDG